MLAQLKEEAVQVAKMEILLLAEAFLVVLMLAMAVGTVAQPTVLVIP